MVGLRIDYRQNLIQNPSTFIDFERSDLFLMRDCVNV